MQKRIDSLVSKVNGVVIGLQSASFSFGLNVYSPSSVALNFASVVYLSWKDEIHKTGATVRGQHPNQTAKKYLHHLPSRQ
jgi:hypothetical protein